MFRSAGAGKTVHAEAVGEFVIDVQRELREVGVQLVESMFTPDRMSSVADGIQRKRPGLDGVQVRVRGEALDIDCALLPPKEHLQVFVIPSRIKLREQGIERNLGAVGRAELQGTGHTQALLLMRQAPVSRN